MNNNYENQGQLVVKVRSGFGIFPLKDALVTVRSEAGEESTVLAEFYTDDMGSTPVVDLSFPFPENQENLRPLPQKYTVEVLKPGFQTVILHGVEVYPGVTTIQSINMAALPDKPIPGLTEYDKEMVQ